MKNSQQSNNNMGLDRYGLDAPKQTSVPGNKVKTTHSIHQRYCDCDDPICKTRRQIYNKPDTNEAREVFTRQNPSTGMNKYDFCTNKKQIDPGGIAALGKKYTQNAIVSERKINIGNEVNYFGENINIDSCMQETPRIPQNRFRAKDAKPNCLEGKMQHYKQHKHSSEQAIAYNNAQPVRGYESEQHMLNVDCNSIGTVPSSTTQGYESQQDQHNFNRDCGMTPGATSSNENFSEDDYPFNERIGVPPLNTIRLQATRHRTKNAILSITTTGEVVIEFIKKRGRAKEEKVTDVCRISDDGLRVVLYQPDEGRGVRVSSEPPPLPSSGTDSLFGYETLPDQHCRKYLYAVRFINLVKAKTPKVTFYSRLTKFQLMETGADFEACFYDGSKISKNAVEGIKITIPDQCPYLCPYDQIPNLSNPDMRNMWEHFLECMTQCQRLDSLLSWNNPCGQNFPIVVGKRPPASTDKLDANKENFPHLEHKDLTEFTTPQFGTTSSTVSATRSEPPSNFAITAGMSNVRNQAARRVQPTHTSSPRSVQVPGIGVATQLLSGEVQVQYNDGAVLTVPPISPGAGIHYAVGGYAAHFRPEDDLPPKLRERLEKISTVIEHLKMAQPAQPTQATKRRPGLRN
ncbi:serine/threonine-protein kinase PLK4-like [Ctenocephalides felis]|uniref:serine/threonine-protein kinase PLK4-like n=1 Tax=Ctenocephalides felis TaxID=7515 RepID=UPI000E6E1DCF|nr:serine/threonine-protein kinase PLK4-like [Ctenocephalides felis]